MGRRLLPALTVATSLAALLSATPARAQSLSAGEAETEASLTLIPELGGAATFDVRLTGLLTPFGDRALSALPDLGLGFGAGYKHYLDIHGALALAMRLRGGFSLDGDPTGGFSHLGVEVGLEARGYSEHFFFGEVGVLATADALFVDGSLVDEDEALVGYRVGAGLETGLGSLIGIDPYWFTSADALIELSWVDVRAADGVAFTANLVVRFDWAWRESWLPDTLPDEDAVDDIYRVLPDAP